LAFYALLDSFIHPMQVAMRDLRVKPLTRLLMQYKESLRKAIVEAASEADRQPAFADLQRLKQMLREAEAPSQRSDTRLERMTAMYDSDVDVLEGALSGGRVPGAATAATTTTIAAADPPPPSSPQLQLQRGPSDAESGSSSATTTTTTTIKRRRTAAAAPAQPAASGGVCAKRRAATAASTATTTTTTTTANPSQEDDEDAVDF
jgi:hypothetical protein